MCDFNFLPFPEIPVTRNGEETENIILSAS